VGFHGGVADVEALGDVVVGQAGRDQGDDLALTGGELAWMVIAESLIGGLFNAARPFLPYTAATALGGVPIGTASFGRGRRMSRRCRSLPGPRCCWRSRWSARCWLIALLCGWMSAEDEAAPTA
jgi:hypothetical protein